MSGVCAGRTDLVAEIVCVEIDESASATDDKMVSSAEQFGVMLWKNWLLQKRRRLNTAVQILLPALMSLILLFSRLTHQATSVTSPTIWDSFKASTSFPSNLTAPVPMSLTPNVTSNLSKWIIVFSPNTSKAATRLSESTARMLDAVPLRKVHFKHLLTSKVQ